MKKYQTKKRFGQHFLNDAAVIQKIINEINPLETDQMVEIGPGLGALSFPLLRRLKQLHVVEIDRDIIARLEKKNDPRLIIHEQDALDFNFAELVNDDKIRVVGNLPYNISTPLIFHLLESSRIIQDMHFMLQNEVVKRITAQPGSKTYGRLSVMVQYHCQTEYLFFVGSGSFSPPPKVDSAIVRLTPWKQAPFKAENKSRFSELVSTAFSMRRKTLRNNLKKMLTAAQIESLGIDPGLRAEMLKVEDFVRLSNLLS